MQTFQQPHTDRPAAPPTHDTPPALPDFRSSTLQPDPADPFAWRQVTTPRARVSRPGGLVPLLVATVLVLTAVVAALAWPHP